jgi:hypothetical protein
VGKPIRKTVTGETRREIKDKTGLEEIGCEN